MEIGIPILQTKLNKPHTRSKLVYRERLITKLNRGIEENRSLTLITGPAGFGKTTLVADWLERAHHSFAWLSLDERDDDMTRFVRYFISAVQKTISSFGHSVINVLNSTQIFGQLVPEEANHQKESSSLQLPEGRRLSEVQEALLTTLLNDLNGIEQRLIFVLDDFHSILNEQIRLLIDLLLRNQIDHLHIVLITRQDPPFPLARIRSQGLITEIGTEELRFLSDEVFDFFNHTLNIRIANNDLEVLTNNTEGWVAGMQLFGLTLRDRSESQLSRLIDSLSGANRNIVDYLGSEVVKNIDPKIKKFLVDTSIFDRFSADLCEAVTGIPKSNKILEGIEHSHLFLVALDDSWFRYHRLFSEFLKSNLTNDRALELHKKAYQWFRKNGLYEEAIKHAQLSGELTEAVKVIVSSVDSVFQSGYLTTVDRWLDMVPENTVRRTGELAFAKAEVLYFSGNIELAESYLKTAELVWRRQENTAGLGRVFTLQCQFTFSRYKESNRSLAESILKTANQALDLLYQNDHLFRGFAMILHGNSLMRLGKADRAREILEQAFRYGEDEGQPAVTIAALSDLVNFLVRQAKITEASALCRDSLARHIDSQGRPLPIAAVVYTHLSSLALAENRLEEALLYSEKASELCESHGWRTLLIATRIATVDIYRAMGETEKASEMIQELVSAAGAIGYPNELTQSRVAEIDFHLSIRNLNPFLRWEKTLSLDVMMANLFDCAIESVCLTFIRGLILSGRFQEVKGPLDLHFQWASTHGFYGSVVSNLLLQTRVFLAQQNREKALSCLNKALAIAAPENLRRPFLDAGDEVNQLIPRVETADRNFALSLAQNEKHKSSGIILPSGLSQLQEDGSKSSRGLSKREIEVLALICEGLSNQEIADRSYIALSTVKTHINNIYAKLNVSSRSRAIALARDLQVIQ